jgi:DNA-binding response OmpR family regulator
MFKQEKILIVEDEAILALELKDFLECNRLTVVNYVPSHQDTEQFLKEQKVDLIIMDINIKGSIDGIQSCNMLFPKYKTPILFMSAYEDEQTLNLIQESYALGYIKKPYKESELLMLIFFILKNKRIPAISQKQQEKINLQNEFTFCNIKQLLFQNNKEIDLSKKEKEILHVLCKNKNNFVSYEHLFSRVWEKESFNINKIRGSIFRLKKKLPMLSLKNSHEHGYKID